MRPTTAFEKLLSSTINVGFVLGCFFPFLFLDLSVFGSKVLLIFLFFVYKIGVICFNHNRSLGMMITGAYWKKEYSLRKQFVHAVLYTLSFSTLLFSFFFPFDLFLLNMSFQFLMVKLTGTTIHGYLSGRMLTVKKS